MISIATDSYSPPLCQKCRPSDTLCTKSCKRWEIQYLSRQAKINAYAKKAVSSNDRIDTTKWGYMHPDEYLRYLASAPCEGCICSNFCDTPCDKYMIHFHEKLEYLRKRAKSHENQSSPDPGAPNPGHQH